MSSAERKRRPIICMAYQYYCVLCVALFETKIPRPTIGVFGFCNFFLLLPSSFQTNSQFLKVIFSRSFARCFPFPIYRAREWLFQNSSSTTIYPTAKVPTNPQKPTHIHNGETFCTLFVTFHSIQHSTIIIVHLAELSSSYLTPVVLLPIQCNTNKVIIIMCPTLRVLSCCQWLFYYYYYQYISHSLIVISMKLFSNLYTSLLIIPPPSSSSSPRVVQ